MTIVAIVTTMTALATLAPFTALTFAGIVASGREDVDVGHDPDSNHIPAESPKSGILTDRCASQRSNVTEIFTMIDVLGPVSAAAHGGCVECDPTDDRSYDDDLYVFQLGSFKIRLCRQHLAMLQTSVARTLVEHA